MIEIHMMCMDEAGLNEDWSGLGAEAVETIAFLKKLEEGPNYLVLTLPAVPRVGDTIVVDDVKLLVRAVEFSASKEGHPGKTIVDYVFGD